MKTPLTILPFPVLICSLVLQGSVLAQQAEQKGQSQAEPAAPKPSPELQKILDRTAQLAATGKHEDALKAADQARAAAQQARDLVGEALAYRLGALASEKLKRDKEAAAAWQQAASAWERVGDGPGQIEALAMAGMRLGRSDPNQAQQLLERALLLGKGETRRPLAAAEALHRAGPAIDATVGGVGELKGRANEFLAAALAIRQKSVPKSVPVAQTLNALARVAIRQRNWAGAEDYLSRALAVAESAAPGSLTVAESLAAFGELEEGRKNLVGCKQYYRRVIALQERIVPDSLELAATLDRISRTLWGLSELSEAQRNLQRALAIREKLAPDSEAVAASLTHLGIVTAELGDLPLARTYHERSLAISDRRGFETVKPNALVNIGLVADAQSDFAAARNYYQQAFSLFEKMEPGNRGIAIALGNLAGVSFRQGDLTSASEYWRRALTLHEERGRDWDVAGVLSGLGSVELARGDFVAAQNYFQRALAIREKLIPGSLEVAEIITHLGEVAKAKRETESARQYFQQGLELEQKLAPGSYTVARSLSKLGAVAYLDREWGLAQSYYRRALAIRERLLGPHHPYVAQDLLAIAKIQAQMGDTAAALRAALRAEEIGRQHMGISARTMSERQALAYASMRPSGLDVALSLMTKAEAKAARDVFDAVIRSRALVFEEMAARHRAVHEAENPDVVSLANRLSSASARLATLVLRGPGADEDRYLKLLEETRKEKEQAERALGEKSAGFRQRQARSRIGFEKVSMALPVDAILVAFVRYGSYGLEAEAAGKSLEPVPSYLAFVLRTGEREPAALPLGKAEEIEPVVARWRELMGQEALAAGRAPQRTESAYRAAATELRQKVWDPLAPKLRAAKRVFVVPDGALHLVNFAALPVGDASYLVERGPLIHYLSAERDLVPPRARRENEGLLALGAPAFDDSRLFAALVPQDNKRTASQKDQPAALQTFRGNRSGCGEFQSLSFEPLPASAQEATEIAGVWTKSTSSHQETRRQLRSAGSGNANRLLYLTGPDATEAAFKQQAPGKRVLHLATHGFFLGGRCSSALDSSVKAGDEMQRAAVIGENPLLLSGLALAGANHRQVAGSDEEDGILTAEEIAAMDLNGVEWAVLSACDTGVGEVKAGEGVFGLRRAFQVAGARTVIMSLWPVEDKEAQLWMRTLYQGHFVEHLSTAESVRNASLTILYLRRAMGLSAHPFYWAGFVAAGDWR